MYKNPTIDLTTEIAVDSLFTYRDKIGEDPWGKQAIAAFADLAVYGDKIGYFAPQTSEGQHPSEVVVEGLLSEFKRQNKEVLNPIAFPGYLAKQVGLDEKRFKKFFKRFLRWLEEGQNLYYTKGWLQTQMLYALNHKKRIGGGTLFQYDKFGPSSRALVAGAARQTGLADDLLIYAFDVMFRYVLYKPLTPRGELYLNHPIRDTAAIPGLNFRRNANLLVPITLKYWSEKAADTMTIEEFVGTLLTTRDLAEKWKLKGKEATQIELDNLRGFAFDAKLPATLKPSVARALDFTIAAASGVAGVAASFGGVDLNPWVSGIIGGALSVGGFAVSLKTNFWKDVLADSVLHEETGKWADTLEWVPLESQLPAKRRGYP